MAVPLLVAVPAIAAALWKFVLACVAFYARHRAKMLIMGVTTGAPLALAVNDMTGEGLEEIARRWNILLAHQFNYWVGTDAFRAEDFSSDKGFAYGMARYASQQTGIQLRDIFDKETTIADLESYSLGMIEKRSGVKLNSLRNVDSLKRDFARLAGAEISERVGIPLSNILDKETTKMEIIDWAQDMVMMKISDSVSSAVAAQVQQGGATLLKSIQDKMGKKVSGRSLLAGINDAMAGRYMVRWEAFQKITKEDRRKLQLKVAQRRFRDRGNPKSEVFDGRTGGRMEYVPKGWNAQVSPPNVPGLIATVGRKAKSALNKVKEKLPAPAVPKGYPSPTPPNPTEAQVP